MDTDDLSEETYKAVLMEAGKYSRDLIMYFGMQARKCKNEEEYIAQSEDLIASLQEMDAEELRQLFFGNPPRKAALHKTLKKIMANLEKVKEIPPEKRNYEF
jgi:hypothetical protein